MAGFKMFDFIIVGAGFAGAVLAERIASVLNKKVLIIDKRNHIGGNCHDHRDENGIIVHKYGPHLFHTDYKEVWNYLCGFTEWHLYQHEVLAFVEGKKIHVPFNLNSLYQAFPRSLARKLEEKLLHHHGYGTRIPVLELKKSVDQDLRFLANYIYQNIYLHYSTKQWGMGPEGMDSSVTARIPVYISRDDRYFVDRYQGVPKEGYNRLFERMLSHPNIKLLLNTNFQEVLTVDTEKRKIFFLGQQFDGKLIFTGLIDELFGYKFGVLPHRSLELKFETVQMEYFQEAAVVNYPNNYDFTRITEFKHIHPTVARQTTILTEYPKTYVAGKSTPYFPVLTNAAQETYLKYKEISELLDNLILIGRLAEFRYYDMDDVVKKALDVFDEKLR